MKRIRQFALVLSLASLVAFGPEEQAAPAHWALVVGVTDYIHYEDGEGGDLPGAERDARAFRDVLVSRWGFLDENIRLILNRDATRAAIQEGITGWLTQNARPGDNVIVFFAGHGAQVWDENGDEDDGLDETIAPADVDPTSPTFDIVDDEMGEWLRALPTRNVVYIHDNCNAGTGTRDVTPFSKARKLARAVDALPRPAGVAGTRAVPGQDDASGFDLADVEVLELAAAQPEQAAVDAFFPAEGGAEAFHGGAFSTFLIRELWRAPADATYEEIFRAVVESLKQNRFQQSPHLSEEGTLKSAPLFFVDGGVSSGGGASVPVLSVSGGRAELGAGAALGLTPGSVMAAEGGARVLLETVNRDRASGRVLSGALAAGARVQPVGYRFPENPLRVNVGGIDSETVAALRQSLENNPAVVLVAAEADFSHLLLRRRANEVRVLGQDGFSRTERPFPVGSEGASALAEHLLKEAAAFRLVAMDNIGQTFKAGLVMGDGRTSYGLGERVTFEVTSERQGYVTLVDLGTDGTVTVLFPNQYDQRSQIAPGQRLRFPTEAMGFEIEAQPPVGRGMVRLFVTPQPLEIPASEGFFAGRTDAAELLARSLRAAAGTVEGAPDAVRLDTWGTATLVYDVTR